MKEETIEGGQKLDLKDITSDVKEYVNLRLQVIRLNVTEKISSGLANLITSGAVILFYLLAFIFTSFALCYYIGRQIGNLSLGFLIVAGFYIILGLIINFASHKNLRSHLTDRFIDDFSKDDEDEK